MRYDDPRTGLALEALRRPRALFDDAVASAAERLRSLIEAQRAGRTGRVAGVSAELGRFASGRIDFDRFAGVFDPGPTIPPAELARISAAHDVLAGLIRDGVAPHVVRLKATEDLRMEVGYTLARVGRVFGAARAATKARDGMGTLRDEALLAAFAFRNWNRAEKAIAPPLVFEVPGATLRADGLGDFLDGRLRIVLVVTGAAPVAALAEVVTPSVFVAQARLAASDAGSEGDAQRAASDVLKRLAAFDGPGIVALIEGECAEFVHDPSAPLAQRMVVSREIEAGEQGVGAITAFRQAEGVKLLALLAAGYATQLADASPTQPEAWTPAAEEASPADKLAAWLLKQAEVPEPR